VPEPKPVKTVKAADPIKELDNAAPQDDPDSMNLPIDDVEPEPSESESSDDNPYDKGTPQHRRFEQFRKENGSLKTELDAERQTRTQLETRVKEIEAAAARAEELEEKIKGYEAKITVSNLTESEAYKEQIAKPLINILERSDAIADSYGIDRDKLAETLEISDEKARKAAFKELTSGFDIDPDDALEMRALAKEVQPLKARREELLANADKALAELEATKTRSEQEQTLRAAEERKETVDKVAKHITTKLPFLKTLDGVDFDGLVDSVKESDFNALDTPNKAYSQIAAQLLPKLVRSYDAAIKEVERLSDDLSKYKKQTPRIERDSGVADTGDDEEGFLDRAKKQLYGQ
jgi:small-conductance mechanosensitive channel